MSKPRKEAVFPDVSPLFPVFPIFPAAAVPGAPAAGRLRRQGARASAASPSATGRAYAPHRSGGSRVPCTYGNISTRSGLSYGLDVSVSRRNQFASDGVSLDDFRDHTLGPSFGLGQKTLYQQGQVSDTFGQIAGQSYNLLSLSQGVLVSRLFSVQLNYSRQTQGGVLAMQAIATGT